MMMLEGVGCAHMFGEWKLVLWVVKIKCMAVNINCAHMQVRTARGLTYI